MRNVIKSVSKQAMAYGLFVCIGLAAGCSNSGASIGQTCYDATPTNLTAIETCVKNACANKFGAGSFNSKTCCQDACNAGKGKNGFTDQDFTDCLGNSSNC